MEAMVQWLVEHLGGSAGKDLTIFVISMIPILELRGALLAASPAFLDVPILRAIPLCIVGNILPVPFILLLITRIFDWMKGTKLLRGVAQKLEDKALGKKERLKRYEFLGLVLFVGIPLPGTGAWTGALLATLLGIRFRKAFPAIVLGIFMATVIVGIISYGLLGAIAG